MKCRLACLFCFIVLACVTAALYFTGIAERFIDFGGEKVNVCERISEERMAAIKNYTESLEAVDYEEDQPY